MQETQAMQIQSLGRKDSLEEGMATHSSLLAWRIPWRETPGGLQSPGLQRVRHDWATWHSMHASIKDSYTQHVRVTQMWSDVTFAPKIQVELASKSMNALVIFQIPETVLAGGKKSATWELKVKLCAVLSRFSYVQLFARFMKVTARFMKVAARFMKVAARFMKVSESHKEQMSPWKILVFF